LPAFAHFACLAAAISLYSSDTLAQFPNRVANEIAMNGVSSFFRAARTSDIDYGHYYLAGDARRNFELVAHDLGRGGGQFTRLAEGRLDRHFAADPAGLGRLNVVVVMEESFGAEFSRLYGSTREWTPNFDQFARRGLWFSRAYASGTRTVRGLEAITTSFPPIPTVSILRRPGNEHIANWGQVMQQQGYHTSFLYGGYGYFDNMNYFYENNGFAVIDRKQIPHPRFANIWGVADEDLFDKALEHFDAEAQSAHPFFSMIMTTSNHKPFTFRDGVPGVPAQGGGREAGVRYADYALGYFLRATSKHSWFDNTLFVVVADHGARVYGRAEIPLRSYEIPLMVYSPKHVAAREIATLATQVDIAPTVLGMLGLEYEAPFFGRDVLHHVDAPQLAFFSHNHDVAVFRDNELAVLGLRKSHQTLTYHEQSDTYAPVEDDSALLDLAVAYYQTASDLFAHHTYEIDTTARTDADASQIRQAKIQAAATPRPGLAP
jgi:phosphoglycerol transferase MdoB-like AlkP superfamily enzyme